MSGWLTIDVACETEGCNYRSDQLFARDAAPPIGEFAGFCPHCECPVLRVPSVLNVTRASFVDGTRRFDGLRQQARLDMALSESQDRKERAEILREKDKASSQVKDNNKTLKRPPGS